MKGSLPYISKCVGSRHLRRRRIGSTRSPITIALRHKASGTATLLCKIMLGNGSVSGFCAHKSIRCLALDCSQPRRHPVWEVMWPVLAVLKISSRKRFDICRLGRSRPGALTNGATLLLLFACLVSTSDEWRQRSSCVHLGPEIVPGSSKELKVLCSEEPTRTLSHLERRSTFGSATALQDGEQGYFTQTKCVFLLRR